MLQTLKRHLGAPLTPPLLGNIIPASEALEITLVCPHCVQAVLPIDRNDDLVCDKVEKKSRSEGSVCDGMRHASKKTGR